MLRRHGPFSAMAVRPRPLANSVLKACLLATPQSRRNPTGARHQHRSAVIADNRANHRAASNAHAQTAPEIIELWPTAPPRRPGQHGTRTAQPHRQHHACVSTAPHRLPSGASQRHRRGGDFRRWLCPHRGRQRKHARLPVAAILRHHRLRTDLPHAGRRLAPVGAIPGRPARAANRALARCHRRHRCNPHRRHRLSPPAANLPA